MSPRARFTWFVTREKRCRCAVACAERRKVTAVNVAVVAPAPLMEMEGKLKESSSATAQTPLAPEPIARPGRASRRASMPRRASQGKALPQLHGQCRVARVLVREARAAHIDTGMQIARKTRASGRPAGPLVSPCWFAGGTCLRRAWWRPPWRRARIKRALVDARRCRKALVIRPVHCPQLLCRHYVS